MLRDNNSLTIVSKSGSKKGFAVCTWAWGALGGEVTSIPSVTAVDKLFILLKDGFNGDNPKKEQVFEWKVVFFGISFGEG